MAEVALDGALGSWCVSVLGAEPAEVIFHKVSMSRVYGLRLADGRTAVLKVRPDPAERAGRCVAYQEALHRGGFPCPAPLSGVETVDGCSVHLEQWVPGGHRLHGVAPDVTAAFARLLADLVAMTATLDLAPPVPAPIWAAWDHPGPGLWPDDGVHLPDAGHSRLPRFVLDAARRVRRRLSDIDLPGVVGHSDWETQNMAWLGMRPFVVHDWDSLAWRPEAAIAGAAAATFPTDDQPVLAPIGASARFLTEYQSARGITFSDEELEVSWGSGLWLAAHNARMEAIYDKPPLVIAALAVQAGERLRRAGA